MCAQDVALFVVMAGYCLVTLALMSLDKDLEALILHLKQRGRTGEAIDGD